MKNKFQKLVSKANSLIQTPELISTLFNKVNREFCKDLLLLKKEMGFNFHTIIDVGAAVGEYSKAAHFVYSNAKILAFEPIPDSFEKLKNLSNDIKNIQCFNIALSDKEGESLFNLNDFSYSSSLLKMTNIHKEIYPITKNETTIKVKTNKLENILSNINKDILLKIDVQGAELKVLKGADKLLKDIKVIQLEVNFMNFYEGQASFEEILILLKKFKFFNFVQINPIIERENLLFSDFIFWKN